LLDEMVAALSKVFQAQADALVAKIRGLGTSAEQNFAPEIQSLCQLAETIARLTKAEERD